MLPLDLMRAHRIRLALSKNPRLHLGCGGIILNDWVNLDFKPGRGGLNWDLTRKLPLEDSSAELIYTEHFIEHLNKLAGAKFISECHRLLKSGGVLRISTPDLAHLTKNYLSGTISGWEPLGWSPATPCDFLNEAMRLWGHQYLYDADELMALLSRIGFENVRRTSWHQSSVPRLADLESRPFSGDLIVEGVRR
jgi:predicted SAM-dependent methyltransferase